MWFPQQLATHQLAEFCHRQSVELAAGIDIRRVWAREANNAPPRYRDEFAKVRERVNAGDELVTAMRAAGRVFPPLVLEMVQVGEATGMLAEVFRRLAAHYRHQHTMQRTFLALIAWPAIQLLIALLVIGILIAVIGIIGDRGHESLDILGFGLVGTRGLAIYLVLLGAVALAAGSLVVLLRRNPWAAQSVFRLALRLPLIGVSLEKIFLARLTWALHLTLNVEMDLRQSVPLALRATGNPYYESCSDEIVRTVAAGEPLHVAFAAPGIFSAYFLEALEVGEESGQLVRATERLSHHYQEEAESALKALSVIAGIAVWAIVATMIILMIFRIFGFYLGTLNNALEMTR